MGRIKERAALVTVKKGPSCEMGDLLTDMDSEDRADTEELLASKVYGTLIQRVLDEEGFGKVSIHSLRNHRNQLCACDRG